MNNLSRAKEGLLSGRSVCLCKGEDILCSDGKGIAFIAFLARDGRRFDGYSVADKIVGKAAAHVYDILGVCEVYGNVMTEEGKALLERKGVLVSYGQLVKEIINRTGDGICPMEEVVKEVTDSHVALGKILEKLDMLKKGKI